MEKLTVYPIHGIADAWDDDPLDTSRLPFEVMPNVTVEDISSLITPELFNWMRSELTGRQIESLQAVRYAIVHRRGSGFLDRDAEDAAAEELVQQLAAALRLVRPMRQTALLFQLRIDGTHHDVFHVEHPIELMEIPEPHKLFDLRNRDLDRFKSVGPALVRAFEQQIWKVRMPMQFYQAGYFRDEMWKTRFILWMCGIDGIYTSQTRDHNGKLVATERIKYFLGPTTRIYEPGDLQSFIPDCALTVADIIGDLYTIRNYIAHGERIPDKWFSKVARQGLNGNINWVEMLVEAASFILRASILRIIESGLFKEFESSKATERYFGKLGLTKSKLIPGP